MWNSPRANESIGKTYNRAELTVLFDAADGLVMELPDDPDELVGEIAKEEALRHLTCGQLLWGLHEVFHALLRVDVPVPAGGHPGYQEAIIGELLERARDCVTVELDTGETWDSRESVWTSVMRLRPNEACGKLRSARVSRNRWNSLFELLYDEFLWDSDWRSDALQRSPEHMRQTFQVDQAKLWQQPPLPSAKQVRFARSFLRDVLAE